MTSLLAPLAVAQDPTREEDAAQPADQPSLEELQEQLEAGLITQDEYDKASRVRGPGILSGIDYFPPDWTIVNNGGTCVWEPGSFTGETNLTPGWGDFADANSDWCGSGTTMDTELWTPVMDLSGSAAATLEFANYFWNYAADEWAYVDISTDDGWTWTNLASWNVDIQPGIVTVLDLTPFVGFPNTIIRFHYVAPGWDGDWQVDNVWIYDNVGDILYEEFEPPVPAFDTSYKLASPKVEPDNIIDYGVVVFNSGDAPAYNAVMTDVIPAGTSYVPGSVTCDYGTCWYEPADDAVYWTGVLGGSPPARANSPTPGELLAPAGGSREPQAELTDFRDAHHTVVPGTAGAGVVIENFPNSWDTTTIGLVYNPGTDFVRYAHESSPNPTIYDVDYPVPHNLLGSISLSALNPGWPVGLDNRDGAAYDATIDTYLMPDFQGDLSNADDNIIEIDVAGTILNAWETDGASNDSYDGSFINTIMDMAVAPGAPTRYFVAAAGDGSLVYEIELIKTGVWWTPNTWGTITTWPVPGIGDNVGIDFDAEHGVLYHSDANSTNIVVTDLDGNVLDAFTCNSPAGSNTGVTYIEGKAVPEVWVTDNTSNSTTRCEIIQPPPCGPITVFFDDFEGGLGNWATTGLWNEENEGDACGSLVAPFPSSDTSAYYGQDGICNYDTGATNAGELEMILDVDLSQAVGASLHFWSFEETECGGGNCGFDERYVDVSTDGGATWATVWGSMGPEGQWYPTSADLSAYVGGPLRVRFRFDTYDASLNGYFGWLVDDVEIAACMNSEATVNFQVVADEVMCGDVVFNEAVIDDPDAPEPTWVMAETEVWDIIHLHEDFEGAFPPAGWQVLDNAGTGMVWDRNDAFGEPNQCAFGSGYSAAAHAEGSGLAWDTELWSPPITLPPGSSAVLKYASNFQDYAGNGDIYLDVSTDGGMSWTNLRSQTADDPAGGTLEFEDLSTFAGETLVMRWVYTATDAAAWYWHIDDVQVVSCIPPDMVVDPPPLEAELCPGEVTSIGFPICNASPGTLPLAWALSEITGTFTLAPLAPTDMGFAQDIGYISDNFVTFVLDDFPGQTVLGTTTDAYYGMDFDPEATTLYALNDTTGELGTIDLADGTFTALVPCPAPVDIWTGLSIDPVTGVFYASDATSLYTIDPATGASTLVGPFGTSLMIDIAMGPNGDMYGHDIGTDSTYLIDPATGAATLIGPTGYNANYAQGLDFDNEDGTLYIFLYQGGGSNVYGTVDLATGAVIPLAIDNPLGEFEGATQTSALPPFDVPWLDEIPSEGLLMPTECVTVEVIFDATDMAAGTYYATLGLDSNDPDMPWMTLPVTLTVRVPPTIDVTPMALETPTCPGDMEFLDLEICNLGECTLDWFAVEISATAELAGSATVEPAGTAQAGPIPEAPLTDSAPASGPLVTPDAPASPEAVLWDQPLSGTNQGTYANQDFEPAFDLYDIFIADDFANDGWWAIDTLFVVANTWNAGCNLDCADALNWQVYGDAGGMPAGDPWGGGDPPLWAMSLPADDPMVTLGTGTGGFQTNVTLTLDIPLYLPPDTYWLLFFPSLNFGDCGCQSGRQVADTTNGNAAQVINPGGGFGFPTAWTSVQDPATWALAQQDLAFRLEGEVLPDVPWLSLNPPGGTVDPAMCMTSEAILDSAGLLPGDYYADLILVSNDPFAPITTLPVTFTVLTPVDIEGLAFTWTPETPLAGEPVDFSATEPLTGTPPFTYIWDFGDGFGDVGQDVSHAYSTADDYEVTLTVENACGEGTITDTLTVELGLNYIYLPIVVKDY
jgi:uncharacterized repeat protein (TIGR01451 family)